MHLRRFMRLWLASAIGGISAMAGLAVLACDSSSSATASNDITATTQEVTLATCDLLPNDTSAKLPLITPGSSDPLQTHREDPAPPVDAVLTHAVIKMKIGRREDGKGVVSEINATVTQGAKNGTFVFHPLSLGGHRYDALNECDAACDPREKDRRAELFGLSDTTAGCGADPAACESQLTLDGQTKKFNHVLLQWESSKEAFFVLGYDRTGGTPQLVATAPKCTFDARGFRLLRDVEACEDALFEDQDLAPLCTAANDPVPSEPSLEDGGSADSSTEGGDAGDAGDASTTLLPDGAAPTVRFEPPQHRADIVESPMADESSADETTGTKLGPRSTKKTTSAGCSSAPSSPSSNASGGVAGLAVAFVMLALQRRRSRR